MTDTRIDVRRAQAGIDGDATIDRQPPGRPTRIAVVGLGYVGLPTALAFATRGIATLGIDASPARLAAIAAHDVDLIPADELRLRRLADDRTLATTTDPAAIAAADAVIICVPTPVDGHRCPDLGPLEAACASVVASARIGQTIILTSTTYVGSTRDLLVKPLAARGLVAGNNIAVAFSPERIDPANETFTQDLVPRIVGGATRQCGERAAVILGEIAPVHCVSTAETAEMTKLYENTFRAVNIALANEMADVSSTLGLDPIEVIEAAATKPYGFMPFYPGPGVGGHCIPCDPHYLLWQLKAERVLAPLVTQAMDAISARPARVVSRVMETLAECRHAIAGARVIVVGVSYKPDVADVRESPALEIMDGLVERGAIVDFVDPHVASLRLGDGQTLESVDHPLDGDYDIALVHTAHSNANHDWLNAMPLVLDASFRLDGVTGAGRL